VVLSRLAFVRDTKGPAVLERVLARAGSDLRDVRPGGWYPFDDGERLDSAIAEEMGGGDKVFLEMGKRSAEFNLGDTQKLFVQGRDPHGLLRSASAIYRLYYDTGSRTYQAQSSRRAVLRTLQSRSFSRSDCLTVIGWHEKAIELCGGKHPRVSHPKCRAEGDAWCEYVCEWS